MPTQNVDQIKMGRPLVKIMEKLKVPILILGILEISG